MSTNYALVWDYFIPQNTEEDVYNPPFRNLENYVFGTANFESILLESKKFTIKDESKAYREQKAEIEEKYMGQYVAVYRGEVVDHDSDKSTLLHRFYDTFGNKTVYIKKVGEPERIYKVHTPFRR
ncbi:MAG: hypothetical protein IID03_11640 [Candidatus Dadabacteria bacterium]|nr:hypothetical protein [Candidatus Dadabacteria bacterium]